MRRTVAILFLLKFYCKCVENMERKGEKIMAFFNDVATSSQSYDALRGKQLNGIFDDLPTKSQSYDALYGTQLNGVRETPLGKPLEYDSGTRVERYSLQRVDGQKTYASKKVVILPKNSPLRKLNMDKFVLTREKVYNPYDCDVISSGLKKTLKLFNKNGEVMFEGIDSIRQFMKSIAHIIRK